MNNKLLSQLNKAQQLYDHGDYKKALAMVNKILKLNATIPEALFLQANAYQAMGKTNKSIPLFEKILNIYPDNNTVILILSQYYSKEQDWENLSRITHHALKYPHHADTFIQANVALHTLCDWDTIDQFRDQMMAVIQQNTHNPIMFQESLFSMLALPNFSEEEIFATHKLVAQRFMDAAQDKQYSSHQKAGKKLKIGYVSGDLALHPVGLFVQFCIEFHHRDYFEVYCYADMVYNDELTDKFKRISDHFIEITEQPAADVAKQIHDDGIDILIDLGGYTGRVLLEIFAYKPAPVQISYCGYPYSTALPTIDYRITDPYAEGNVKNYTEELIYMPDSFLCMGGGYTYASCSPAPSEKKGYITFGSFNDLRKVNIPVIKLWSKVLSAVPDSKLLIRNRKVEGIFAQKIIKQFEKCGIGTDRLIFIHGNLSADEHCAYYKEVDIILDVFPFCGATTSLETLWYNVPIITLVGEAHRQRPTYSMLKNIGFTEGVAFSEDEYVEKAVAMGSKSGKALTLIRHCLYSLTRASILFQPEAFTHQLDQLLINTWNKKMADNRSFDVPSPTYSYTFPLNTKQESIVDITKIDDQQDAAISLNVDDSVDITVPNNINLLTPYILAEQQDWFEDEIKFVRNMIQPDMQIIDIGASYGTYCLSIATTLNNSGYVWAFEPTDDTYQLLKSSIENNHLSNISAINEGVSNENTTAPLHLDGNSEYNSFLQANNNFHAKVDVQTHTLDHYQKKHGWKAIDFVKIDTEGSELNIIKGGKLFFEQHSPLLMASSKDGDAMNANLIDAFKNMGYDAYMLIPGLQILAPFNDAENQDYHLLNLFYCQEKTAQKLQQQGLLALNKDVEPSHTESTHTEAPQWKSHMLSFSYCEALINTWERNIEQQHLAGWSAYNMALHLYFKAFNDATLSPSGRFAALENAFIQVVSSLGEHASIPRLLTLVRIASALGKREIACQMLNDIINNLYETSTFHPDEPFLAVSKTAEDNDSQDNLASWCLAYAIAEREMLSSFSSFFADETAIENARVFKELGFQHEEMQRRYHLISKRFKLIE